jgi:hypothetical protein
MRLPIFVWINLSIFVFISTVNTPNQSLLIFHTKSDALARFHRNVVIPRGMAFEQKILFEFLEVLDAFEAQRWEYLALMTIIMKKET